MFCKKIVHWVNVSITIVSMCQDFDSQYICILAKISEGQEWLLLFAMHYICGIDQLLQLISRTPPVLLSWHEVECREEILPALECQTMHH